VQLIDVKQIAEMMSLSKGHVADRLIFREDFPHPFMIGSRRRWDKAEIEKWVRKKRSSPKG